MVPPIMNLTSTGIRPALTALILMGASAAFPGCKGELEEEAPKPVEVKKKSNIIKIQTAVMPGKHLACDAVFPDVAVFTETIGTEIGSIKDKGKNNSSATFVCSVIRAGDQPESVKEAKTLEEKYAKLGVLPGDSFCQITAFCSRATNKDEFEKKCKADGNQEAILAGEFACLRATEKAAEYSYTYKFIDPETKCVVEALAGPSVISQEVVKNCALAARKSITVAGMADPK